MAKTQGLRKDTEGSRFEVMAVKKKRGRKPKGTIRKSQNGVATFPKKRGRKPKSKLPEPMDAYSRDQQFIDLTAALRVHSLTEPVDAERCVSLLQQLNTLPMTSMMVLRWPQCVELVRNLSLKKPRFLTRKYPEIQSLAGALLKRCLNAVNYKGDKWKTYRAEAKQYAAITKDMTITQKLQMSRCAFNRLRQLRGYSKC